MEKCAERGLTCAGGRRHPFKSGAGLGLLGECHGALRVTLSCWYYYQNGDMCIYRFGLSPLCRYENCP